MRWLTRPLIATARNTGNPVYTVCSFLQRLGILAYLLSFHRYSKGFGLVELLIGKEHVLNIPNCVLGIIFYTMQLLLGE